MPISPKKLCRASGCTVLTHNGYCDNHAHIPIEKERTRKQKYYKERPPWHSWYGSERWRMLRSKILFAFPHCRECKEHGLLTLATVVDHIKAHKGNPHLFWDVENLSSLCKPCHDRKTSREDSWN